MSGRFYPSACWIRIDRAALRHNLAQVRTLCGEGTGIIAVVKANAYGCGAAECARVFAEPGDVALAVTRPEEALELREANITAAILLLAPVVPGAEAAVVEMGVTACVSSLEVAERLSAAASRHPVPVHLKLDTGMGRFGVPAETAAETVAAIRSLPNLKLEGVFTHFANASDPDSKLTQNQLRRFLAAKAALRETATDLLWHAANSSALVRFPETRLSAVRPGTVLYGQFPAPTVTEAGRAAGMKLEDPFSARARIVTLHQVKTGDPVGYGSEWKAPGASTVAIVACGYADGLSMEPRARVEHPLDAVKGGIERAARLLKDAQSGRIATVWERKVPIVGRIGMQTCTLDVTGVPGVAVGDEVVLPMRRVSAGAHLPRVYVG